jgi:hypothetical protein
MLEMEFRKKQRERAGHGIIPPLGKLRQEDQMVLGQPRLCNKNLSQNKMRGEGRKEREI